MFNLILPSSPLFPRPDLCCSITYLGDFIAGIIQVIINGIKSLALDLPDPEYFTKGDEDFQTLCCVLNAF